VVFWKASENCKSKQASLQLYADATGNFVLCLQLSKLKLGLELKQKNPPKPQILNNSYPTFLE